MLLGRFLSNLIKASLVTSALSVSAFAGADDYYNNHHDGCAPVCGQVNFHPSANGCNTGCDTCCGTPCNPAPSCNWGYNPPAYARCGCDTGCNAGNNGFLDSFAFRADFLWWRACEDGLDLGVEETISTATSITDPIRTVVVNRAHEKRPNFKYDPGFRIGLANHCSCDCWDFAVNWTHFRTKANVNGASVPSIAGAPAVAFFSDWERVVGANPTAAAGRFTLNIDLVDIEFGRKFYVSNCFILRPQFGLRFARINQNYRVESTAINTLAPTATLANYISTVKAHSDFLSVGPRVGLDIELDIGCGLSLFGCAAGSITFGKFDDHSREHLEQNVGGTGAAIAAFDYEAKSSAHRCSRAITDLAFGVKWVRCIDWCNRSHPVSLAFAWEHHGFYNMNNFNFAERGVDFVGAVGAVPPTGVANGNNVRKHGDLYTQGLTVSLCFGF